MINDLSAVVVSDKHKERLATSPKLVIRLHQPHAILVRFHVQKIGVVILIPEKAVSVCVSCQ